MGECEGKGPSESTFFNLFPNGLSSGWARGSLPHGRAIEGDGGD